MVVETIKVFIVLIINSYEDLDFSCYMEQSARIAEGETDYTQISSKNGLLVYPAVNSYINLFIYKFVTAKGVYYQPAQVLGGMAYLVWIFCMVRIAQLAFKETPQRANIVLLHWFTFVSLNIAVEQLFNDAFWVMFWLLAILQFQESRNLLGVFFFSLGLGVKMSAALYIPAIYLITSRSQGIIRGTCYLVLIVVSQIVLAYPFIEEYPSEYISSAFNLNRDFVSRVSFNWNIIADEYSHSNIFKRGLLILHLVFLIFFLFSRWLNIKKMIRDLGVWPVRLCDSNSIASPYFVAEVFIIWNFIGLVWARGIHYQFVSWYLFSLPFLIDHGLLNRFSPSAKDLIFLVVLLDGWYTLRGNSNHFTPVLAQIIMIVVFAFNIRTAILKQSIIEQEVLPLGQDSQINKIDESNANFLKK